MTTTETAHPNPFALLIDPEAILAAVAGSDRLARLRSRICRPLDKPLLALAEGEGEGEEGGETIYDDALDVLPEHGES